MQYTADNLLVRPTAFPNDPDLLLRIDPERAGWRFISFEVRRLNRQAHWSFATGDNELVLVNLSGRYSVEADCGRWTDIGGRPDVFAGPAHALYLPRRTRFTVRAEDAGELAVAWAPAERDREPFLITPDHVRRSIRGGGNASRQINDLLPPGSPVDRLVLVEVYTPGGNWSSYPPHKHDCLLIDPAGDVLEADLEEVYFFKIQRPEGFAFQWIYTDPTSPLHADGYPIDACIRVGDGCAVLVPEGYHPVTAMPGYNVYYLNVLAGPIASLANLDDPRFAWVKNAYGPPDPRLPFY